MSENIKNEMIKSAATWRNNMSVACFTVGVLGPFFSALGIGDDTTFKIITHLPAFLIFQGKGNLIVLLLVLGILFRRSARNVLRGLDVEGPAQNAFQSALPR